MTDQELLAHEIYELTEIVKSNIAALKFKKTTDSDRVLLKMQIRLRGLRLVVLNQHLTDLSDVSRRAWQFPQITKHDRQHRPASRA